MAENVFVNPPELMRQLEHVWSEAPATRPRPVGLQPSFGFGDRVGGATDGHIDCLRGAGLDARVAAIFAQQSAREMMRTGRCPARVMLDAVRSVKAAGWRQPWGADADHMKAREQVEACLEAGFTWFTADPSDAVNDAADTMAPAELAAGAKAFAADFPETWSRWMATYAGKRRVFPMDGGGELVLEPTETDLQRVAVKLGRAIHLAAEIYGWVGAGWTGEEPFDFEVSVDETASPTSTIEHLICASELKHLGVRVTALAPRFIGDFEKAVDYIGDTNVFRESLREHAALAKALGPYKISVHSGSDKFSIYPLCHAVCGPLLHVKTAGTSYLEVLRVVAKHDPAAFRTIARYSLAVFAKARATYHLSTNTDNFPNPDRVRDDQLGRTFLDAPEANDPRQVLHVAFGDVLSAADGEIGAVSARVREIIAAHPGDYRDFISAHFRRHMTAFGA